MPLPSEILDQIDEQYRDQESLKQFDSVADLAKSFVETKAMVGNSIRIPSKDAGEEARQEYWNKLINNDPELMMKPDFENKDQSREFFRTIGLPEEFSKYENPEGMKLPDDVEAEMRELLYSASLTNSQYQKIMAAFSDRQAQTTTMQNDMQETGMSDLKGKWGQALDDRIKAAQRTNEEFYPGRDFTVLTGKEIESLYTISAAMTGKGAPAAGDAGGIPADAMTPQEAIDRADEMMNRARNNTNGELSREQVMDLMSKGMALKVKYAGMQGGGVESLR